jgi:hypothetical protein
MKKSWLQCRVILVFVGLLALVTAGCEHKTINQIMAEPNRYAHHEVGIIGTVTQSISVLGVGFYEVDDGTGKIWIFGKAGVPRQGARVGVKGKVQDVINIRSVVKKLPEQIGSGLIMVESSHRAK